MISKGSHMVLLGREIKMYLLKLYEELDIGRVAFFSTTKDYGHHNLSHFYNDLLFHCIFGLPRWNPYILSQRYLAHTNFFCTAVAHR